jgi:sterol desaturase/sphingolipid hydroxylase (fatty acid hydroxylase superfamily)
VIVAASVESSGFGLLSRPWPPIAIRFLIAFLLLDLVNYSIHRAWHSFPLLWRFHQVHHSDPDLDLSTAFRVHPIELIATRGTYLAVLALVAPPVAAVVLYELSRIFLSFVVHANAALPSWIERPARALFITPDLHRIHHSDDERENGKNLGETFSFWDRLFRTYKPEPSAGQAAMNTGLREYQGKPCLGLTFMLALPFLPARSEEASASPGATD